MAAAYCYKVHLICYAVTAGGLSEYSYGPFPEDSSDGGEGAGERRVEGGKGGGGGRRDPLFDCVYGSRIFGRRVLAMSFWWVRLSCGGKEQAHASVRGREMGGGERGVREHAFVCVCACVCVCVSGFRVSHTCMYTCTKALPLLLLSLSLSLLC